MKQIFKTAYITYAASLAKALASLIGERTEGILQGECEMLCWRAFLSLYYSWKASLARDGSGGREC